MIEEKAIPTKKKPLKITPKMQREFETLLAEKGARFRRSDLAERLYGLISPRDRKASEKVAGAILAQAAKAGVIVSAGSVLWKRAENKRTLKSGREINELDS